MSELRPASHIPSSQMVEFGVSSDPVRCVAEDSEDLLGGGGGLLHVGADRHLHVPVQDRLRAVPGNHGHVRGRVSVCI